jgi:hypothetical protein
MLSITSNSGGAIFTNGPSDPGLPAIGAFPVGVVSPDAAGSIRPNIFWFIGGSNIIFIVVGPLPVSRPWCYRNYPIVMMQTGGTTQI